MIKKVLFSLLVLSSSLPLSSAVKLLSNENNKDSTFEFAIGPHGLYLPQSRFFVAATDEVEGNDFALSAAYAYSGDTLMQGLTPAQVKLNSMAETKNPLHGAAISALTLMGRWPVVVKNNLPSTVFLVDDDALLADRSQPIQVFQSSPIQDGHGAVATAFYALETNASRVKEALEAVSLYAAFAAVGGEAADNELSLALLFFKKFIPKAGPYFAWDIVNASTGAPQFTPEGEPTSTGNKALLLTRETPELFINSPLTALGNAADLCFDRDMGRLYIALQVTAGGQDTDGARGVLVGSVANGKLMLQEIAPAEVFESNTGIVGGRGAAAAVTIHKVRTLFTKTLLRYLIVIGGNGAGSELSQQVYALPLVDNLASSSHGKLANIKSAPEDLFDANRPYRFLARAFVVPAKTADEIFTTNDLAALVGGDIPLPGSITDIVVANDAVIVSEHTGGNGLEPGIFSSQPLYDSLGRINGWTQWQRVAGTSKPIVGFSYDPSQAVHWYIPEQAIGGKETTRSVLRTAWSTDADPFSHLIITEFPSRMGGVQGVFDFPRTTPGFSQQPGNRLSVMAYTGLGKVVLVQTGRDRVMQGLTLFGPTDDFEPIYTSEDGTLSHFQGEITLSLSGGVLKDIGPITAAAIATSGASSWFVVGGSGGVAILAGPGGEGWNTATGLTTAFGGLQSSFSWRLIRATKNVRKLMSSGTQLFVLSDDRLERVELSPGSISQGAVQAVTVAALSLEQLSRSSSFSDCIITGPLGLMATSYGLLRTGNGVDIGSVSDSGAARWTQVVLPESAGSLTAAGPASRLFAVTPTLDEGHLIGGGTLYVLNGYVGLNQTQLYRFAVQAVDGIVTDSTVELFPDYFIRGLKTFFANPGEYRNYIVTDGALLALSRSSFGGKRPFLELLSSVRASTLWLAIPEAHSMGKLIRNSASGAWIASGDFGMRLLA